MKRHIASWSLVFFLAFAPNLASAQSEPVILTIDGAIAGGIAVDLTRTQLEAIGAAAIVTATPWHEGTPQFAGVPMKALLEYVNATGEVIEVRALNDYSTSIPVSDFIQYPVILALKQDDAYMSVRDKGPLFIIYPFDDFEELRADLYYARSAWQVRSITVK